MPKSLAPRAAPILVKMGPHAAAAYEPVNVLGRGAFGTAFAVRFKADGRMMVRGHWHCVWQPSPARPGGRIANAAGQTGLNSCVVVPFAAAEALDMSEDLDRVMRWCPFLRQVLKRVELGHMAPDARKEAFNECAVLAKLRDGPFIIRVSEHFEVSAACRERAHNAQRAHNAHGHTVRPGFPALASHESLLRRPHGHRTCAVEHRVLFPQLPSVAFAAGIP